MIYHSNPFLLLSGTLANHTSPSISQYLPKSLQALPAQSHVEKDNAAKLIDGLIKDKNGQLVTKCKCHKGFRGMRRFEVRFNFLCNLIGNHPQSLTALTLNR